MPEIEFDTLQNTHDAHAFIDRLMEERNHFNERNRSCSNYREVVILMIFPSGETTTRTMRGMLLPCGPAAWVL